MTNYNTSRAVADLSYALSDIIAADQTKPQQFVRHITRALLHIEAASKLLNNCRQIARREVIRTKNGQRREPLHPDVSPER